MEGGESLFLDSFHVAEEFRKQFPEQFENLVRIPGTFQKIHFERYTFVPLVPLVPLSSHRSFWEKILVMTDFSDVPFGSFFSLGIIQ